MRTKFIAPLLIAASAIVFTACDGGRAQMEKKESNLLGIVSYESESYLTSGPGTIPIASDEVYDRKNISGDRVTLLWGLVTLQDY